MVNITITLTEDESENTNIHTAIDNTDGVSSEELHKAIALVHMVNNVIRFSAIITNGEVSEHKTYETERDVKNDVS